jgi:hypothetical protein
MPVGGWFRFYPSRCAPKVRVAVMRTKSDFIVETRAAKRRYPRCRRQRVCERDSSGTTREVHFMHFAGDGADSPTRGATRRSGSPKALKKIKRYNIMLFGLFFVYLAEIFKKLKKLNHG